MGKPLMLIFVIPPFWCCHYAEGDDGGNGLGYDLDCLNGESLGLGGLGGLSGLGLGGLSGLGLGGPCSANPLTFWCSSSGTFSKTEDLVVGE